MKITICLSMKFYDKMLEIKKQLEEMGHEVLVPPQEVEDGNGSMIPVSEFYKIRHDNEKDDEWVWNRKQEAMNWHFEKVEKADAVLIVNYTKNGVDHYIGGNTLLEMGLALWFGKPIFLLNPIPTDVSYYEEIRGMKPIVINGDLALIKA